MLVVESNDELCASSKVIKSSDGARQKLAVARIESSGELVSADGRVQMSRTAESRDGAGIARDVPGPPGATGA